MRIRTIKPEFFKHDGIAALPPITRLLFQGLWCLADSEGRLEDRPARIKVEVLPYDKCDVDAMLCALELGGFIARYVSEGLHLIEVLSFRRHQRITGKEAETPSRFPKYNGESAGKQSGNNEETPETTGNGRETEGKGREGKGREGKGREETYSPESRVALFHLNEKTGRAFRETSENLGAIQARLDEPGVTIEGVKSMIDRQCLLWKGDKMEEFLRPSTLFRPSKFNEYYAAKDLPIPNGKHAEKKQLQETITLKSL